MNNRAEYPRPQMVRENWVNLNGVWEFEFDFGKSGLERGIAQKDKLDKEISVPFCPESELSGIGYKDFINACFYRRKFSYDYGQGRVLLNFEAVDYECKVFINGALAGSHKGGYTPFSMDITELLKSGDNILEVYAEDDTRLGKQPCGKQSRSYHSVRCDYTRVTGIWQTVWLENVPEVYIKSYKIIPDIHNKKADITVLFNDAVSKKDIELTAKFSDKIVGAAKAAVYNNKVIISLPLSELHLWEPLNAKLYDLEIRLISGDNVDKIEGYFGMREIRLVDDCMLINGKKVFQRLVLDQGYYKDGIYTASSDEALKRDIQLSMDLGFNGARMHQKVFERRYLYWADKMGYILWGEYGNWGYDHTKPENLGIYIPEWLESMERDFNSPALIGWCPFNETWDVDGCKQNDEILKNVYLVTKAADNTRPVIDTSGNFHVITDIYDVHNYEQDTEKFAAAFEPMINGGEVFDDHKQRQKYNGQPYFVSEYGGIWWSEIDKEGWGYGNRPNSVSEFCERYCSLADTLLKNPKIFALCYTQLYDVEQEVNGLYYYDRTPKFSSEIMSKLTAAMSKKAKIEE